MKETKETKKTSPNNPRFLNKLEDLLANKTNANEPESNNKNPPLATPKNSPRTHKIHHKKSVHRILSPRRHSTKNDDAAALMEMIVGSNNAAFYQRAFDLFDYLTTEHGDIQLFDPHTLSQILSNACLIGYVEDRTNSILKFIGPHQVELSKNLFATESPLLLYLFLKNNNLLSFFMAQVDISTMNGTKLMTLMSMSIIMELHEITSKDTYQTIFRQSSLAISLTRKITETLCSDLIRIFWKKQLDQFRQYDGWPQAYENDKKNFQVLIKQLASNIREYDFGKPLTVLMRIYFDLFNAQSQVFNLINKLINIDHLLSKITENKINIVCIQKEKIAKLQKANDASEKRIQELETNSTAHNDNQKKIEALTSNIEVVNKTILEVKAIIEKAINDAENQSSDHNEKYKSEIKKINRKIETVRKKPLIDRLKNNPKAGSEEEINQTTFSIHQLNYIFWFRIIPQIIEGMDDLTHSNAERTLCKKMTTTLQQAAVNKNDSETTALLANSLFNSTKRMIKSEPSLNLSSLTDHSQMK